MMSKNKMDEGVKRLRSKSIAIEIEVDTYTEQNVNLELYPNSEPLHDYCTYSDLDLNLDQDKELKNTKQADSKFSLNRNVSPNRTSINSPIPTATSLLSSSPFKLFNLIKQNKQPNLNYEAYSQLIQSFPTIIFNMTHLTLINLSNNQINVLPSAINKLTSLEIFYIDRNCLTTLPIEITGLKKLAILNVSNNPIDFNKLHPYIRKFIAMTAWGKKYIELKINKLKNEYTYNKVTRSNEIKNLEIMLENVKTLINNKVKRSIKRMIINNSYLYSDPVKCLDDSRDIELSSKLNLQKLIEIFGSELYCTARRKTKLVTYYDYYNRKQIQTTINLARQESTQYVITFYTVLEYFFNFADSSAHKQMLYGMFNSAFRIVKNEEVKLEKLIYVITNILWFFDDNVDLF